MTILTVLQVKKLAIDAPGGRPLVRDLSLMLGSGERVALVGRNGVGKSSLLGVLAGTLAPEFGEVICSGRRQFVAQDLEDVASTGKAGEAREANADLPGESPGERRARLLREAFDDEPELLLLDEPSHDLDCDESQILIDRLAKTSSAAIVASHDPRVLRSFREFFVMTESGCRLYRGNFDSLLIDLVAENEAREQRYVRSLNHLTAREKKSLEDLQRRTRKKHLGRIREVGRSPSRVKLNDKRSYAQEKQGKRVVRREARIKAARDWAKTTRRILPVDLPLEVALLKLNAATGSPLIKLECVSARAGDRVLFENVSLTIERERLGIIGVNGSGKTTLIEMMVGEREPQQGRASQDLSRIGYVSQNSKNWCLESSVLDLLTTRGDVATSEAAIGYLRAHRFPVALASRPLVSLSPGERIRGALICLSRRSPAPEVLVLDEPTDHLDLLARAALVRVLRRWGGGLVVVSHDEEFLGEIGVGRYVEMSDIR